MADPLSITASIAGVVATGVAVAKALVKIADDFQGAREEIQYFAKEIESTATLLDCLVHSFEEHQSLYRDQLQSLLRELNWKFMLIQQVAERCLRGQGFKRKIRWLFRSPKIRELTRKLDAIKSVMSAILGVIQLAEARRVRNQSNTARDRLVAEQSLSQSRKNAYHLWREPSARISQDSRLIKYEETPREMSVWMAVTLSAPSIPMAALPSSEKNHAVHMVRHAQTSFPFAPMPRIKPRYEASGKELAFDASELELEVLDKYNLAFEERINNDTREIVAFRDKKFEPYEVDMIVGTNAFVKSIPKDLAVDQTPCMQLSLGSVLNRLLAEWTYLTPEEIEQTTARPPVFEIDDDVNMEELDESSEPETVPESPTFSQANETDDAESPNTSRASQDSFWGFGNSKLGSSHQDLPTSSEETKETQARPVTSHDSLPYAPSPPAVPTPPAVPKPPDVAKPPDRAAPSSEGKKGVNSGTGAESAYRFKPEVREPPSRIFIAPAPGFTQDSDSGSYTSDVGTVGTVKPRFPIRPHRAAATAKNKKKSKTNRFPGSQKDKMPGIGSMRNRFQSSNQRWGVRELNTGPGVAPMPYFQPPPGPWPVPPMAGFPPPVNQLPTAIPPRLPSPPPPPRVPVPAVSQEKDQKAPMNNENEPEIDFGNTDIEQRRLDLERQQREQKLQEERFWRETENDMRHRMEEEFEVKYTVKRKAQEELQRAMPEIERKIRQKLDEEEAESMREREARMLDEALAKLRREEEEKRRMEERVKEAAEKAMQKKQSQLEDQIVTLMAQVQLLQEHREPKISSHQNQDFEYTNYGHLYQDSEQDDDTSTVSGFPHGASSPFAWNVFSDRPSKTKGYPPSAVDGFLISDDSESDGEELRMQESEKATTATKDEWSDDMESDTNSSDEEGNIAKSQPWKGPTYLRSLADTGMKPVYIRGTKNGQTWYHGPDPIYSTEFSESKSSKTLPGQPEYESLLVNKASVDPEALDRLGFHYVDLPGPHLCLDPDLTWENIEFLVNLTMTLRELEVCKRLRQGESPSLLPTPPPAEYFRKMRADYEMGRFDTVTNSEGLDPAEHNDPDAGVAKPGRLRKVLRWTASVGLFVAVGMVYSLVNLEGLSAT